MQLRNDESTFSIGQVFADAIAYIRDKGWTQGTWEDDAGCVCALAAINRVIGQRATALVPYAFIEALDNALMGNRRYVAHRATFSPLDDETRLRTWNRLIWSFNDLDDTVVSEIIDAFQAVVDIDMLNAELHWLDPDDGTAPTDIVDQPAGGAENLTHTEELVPVPA